MHSFKATRQWMIERQIKARGIANPSILSAFARVERERFVPDEVRKDAYADRPIGIGYDQTISQPYIVAYMVSELGVSKNDRVLEVGTGSGYETAILQELGAEVYSVEVIGPLQERAESVLGRLGYESVHFKNGDGRLGWPEHAPYDKIIVSAAAPLVPKALTEQLKTGGQMIIPLGGDDQRLVLVSKGAHEVSSLLLLPVRFVPLIGRVKASKKNR